MASFACPGRPAETPVLLLTKRSLLSDHDTVGLLSRRLGSLYDLARSTMKVEEPKKVCCSIRLLTALIGQFPTRILYPKEFFPTVDQDHQSLLDDYVCVLETFLKTTRTEISLIERWAECTPEAAQGKSFKEYLGNVSGICR